MGGSLASDDRLQDLTVKPLSIMSEDKALLRLSFASHEQVQAYLRGSRCGLAPPHRGWSNALSSFKKNTHIIAMMAAIDLAFNVLGKFIPTRIGFPPAILWTYVESLERLRISYQLSSS